MNFSFCNTNVLCDISIFFSLSTIPKEQFPSKAMWLSSAMTLYSRSPSFTTAPFPSEMLSRTFSWQYHSTGAVLMAFVGVRSPCLKRTIHKYMIMWHNYLELAVGNKFEPKDMRKYHRFRNETVTNAATKITVKTAIERYCVIIRGVVDAFLCCNNPSINTSLEVRVGNFTRPH